MDDFDDRLRYRLAALEQTLPVREAVNQPMAPRRSARTVWVGAVAGLLAGVLLAGTVGGAALEAVRGRPGVFSGGGALACSNIRTMSPPNADALLRQLGFDVTWQIEDRDTGESRQSAQPPVTGYVQEGTLSGRALLIVVETGAKAEQIETAPC